MIKKIIMKVIKKIECGNVDIFTTNFGLRFRRYFHRLIQFCFRIVLKYVYKKNIVLVKNVKLEKNKSYVFASNHSFFFDGLAVIATVDRNCYFLFGATEKLYLNFSRR